MGTMDESVLEVCGEGAKVVVIVDFESSSISSGFNILFLSVSGSSFTNFT